MSDRDSNAETLHFANRVTTPFEGWLPAPVNTGTSVRRDTSHTYNEFGEACIAYTDGTDLELEFALYRSNSWQITEVDDSGNIGSGVSMKVSPEDRLVISYYDVINGNLKIARQIRGASAGVLKSILRPSA